MPVPDRHQKIGLLEQASEGVDPFTDANTAYYHFGTIIQPFGNFPTRRYVPLPHYAGGKLDPYFIDIARHAYEGSIGYVPTNNLSHYFTLGAGVVVDSGSAPNQECTLTPTDLYSDQPLFTVRTEKGGTSTRKERHILDSRVRHLGISLDRSAEPFAPLTEAMQFNAKSYTVDAANPFQGASNGLVYAGSVENEFRWDSNALFTWDVGGSNDEYKNDLINFSIVNQSLNSIIPKDGQKDPSSINRGNRATGIVFQLLRRDANMAIVDDFEAQDPDTSSTYKNLKIRIHQSSATSWRQYNFTDVVLSKCDESYAVVEKERKPIYDCEALITSQTFQFEDGLTASTFYGV